MDVDLTVGGAGGGAGGGRATISVRATGGLDYHSLSPQVYNA